MLVELPEDVSTLIFNICDNQSQLILLGTCKKLSSLPYKIKPTKLQFNINFKCYDKIEIYKYFEKWLIQKDIFYCTLARNGDNEVVKYLCRQKKIDTKPLYEGASMVSNLKLLRWLSSNERKYLDIVFEHACIFGHVDLLEYFNSKRFRKLYKVEYSEIAAKNKNINVLRWLINNNLTLSESILCYIVEDQYLDFWDLLFNINFLVNLNKSNKLCKWAIFNKSKKLLKWLLEHNCYVSDDILEVCIYHDHDTSQLVLDYKPDLKKRLGELFLTQDSLKSIDYRFLAWFEKEGININ
jgi:hypothetical protein